LPARRGILPARSRTLPSFPNVLPAGSRILPAIRRPRSWVSPSRTPGSGDFLGTARGVVARREIIVLVRCPSLTVGACTRAARTTAPPPAACRARESRSR
jgi:hypothetical protein